jgi:uncharacterized protein
MHCVSIPSDADIRALHQRFAPSPAAFDLVWTHCEIVARIAARFDPAPLVRAGALLHDIGVYRLAPDEHYIRHGVLGAALLDGLGLPRQLTRFCDHHTGVGLTASDVAGQRLPLPPGDYLAETPQEQIVMYADKFHSKRTPPVFVSAATYQASVSRFGPAKSDAFAAMVKEHGEPDLLSLSAEYGHALI